MSRIDRNMTINDVDAWGIFGPYVIMWAKPSGKRDLVYDFDENPPIR